MKKNLYSKPMLVKLGKVNDITKKNKGGTVNDNPHNAAHLS